MTLSEIENNVIEMLGAVVRDKKDDRHIGVFIKSLYHLVCRITEVIEYHYDFIRLHHEAAVVEIRNFGHDI